MFTGIVEESGKVLGFEETEEAWRLTVSGQQIQEDLEIGDSVSVNGCCLTVVDFDPSTVTFKLLNETLRLTSFNRFTSARVLDEAVGMDSEIVDFGSVGGNLKVNLERSMRFGGKIGGHFMTGHIDCTGKISNIEQRGKDHYLKVEPNEEYMQYLVYKGCIGIDGVSLTVAEVSETDFAVWVIPHTLIVTNFSEIKPGDLVNLEFDLLSKYVEKLLPVRS